MNKTAIKNFAVWARNKLIADITYKAGLIGVSEKGIAQPLPQSSKDLQFFDIGTKDYTQVAGAEIGQRNALVRAIQEKESTSDYNTAFKAVIEEVVYTWFNRLIAIRFMEVNDYLPSRIRVLSSENPAKNEPDFVTTPFDTDMEFTMAEQDQIMQLKDENKLDELFRMLFIKQCNKLHEILPELFEETNNYTEMLLSISFTDSDGVVYHLVHDIDEKDFDITTQDEDGKTPGQVEIIGWMYQYYNIEPKDETFALLKKNVKITKERIPAATQLFTPDWIVRYMVENSLGRLWVEGHPNDSLKENWKYYLEEAEQEASVQEQLEQIRAEYRDLNPEDIKVIDPCMGSGHILVYCFDVLMQIYESQGYTQRDAAQSILENNLYGLDIDKRAAQLAYFAIMMKARQYDRRIFTREIKPHVYAVEESNGINRGQLNYFGADLCPADRNKAKLQITDLLDTMVDAKEYGSILVVENYDWKLLNQYVASIENEGQMSLDSIGLNQTQVRLASIIEIGRIMSQKYHLVCTNPPYLSFNNMSSSLVNFVKDNYADSKTDLYTCCMKQCCNLALNGCFVAMITMESWMSLSKFKKFREYLLSQISITSLVHMPYDGQGKTSLGISFGTSAFVFRKMRQNYNGQYMCIRYYENDEDGNPISFPTINERYVQTKMNVYKVTDDLNISYWLTERMQELFVNADTLSTVADPKQGLATSDNNRYLRLWFEVDRNNESFTTKSKEEAKESGIKWFALTKGGEFRKWYGNNSYVVDWENDGADMKASVMKKYPYLNSPDFVVKNQQYYFRPGITWSTLTSSKISFRSCPSGFIMETKGSICYPHTSLTHNYLLALLNSSVCEKFTAVLSPTIDLHEGPVGKIPYIPAGFRLDQINEIVERNIEICKREWDSHEYSWDFSGSPLLGSTSVEEGFMKWKALCEKEHNELKANEETLNKLIAEIYQLESETICEVEDKYVSVPLADLRSCVIELISYAVGCMVGRYSLSKPGLVYAGGVWDNSNYTIFVPDKDNCIPITDEEYFEDDIVGQFVGWLKKAYGEETLEDNLEFIANALGNKGATSREVIRNYFLNDFFKDHCVTYSVSGSGRRPIYWLFDSGKQGGFKALVYMHRWNADTVGNLRVEYLHKMQHTYEREIVRMQETIDNSRDSREVSNAIKRKDKLQKQLKETKDYDAKLAHIALSRIEIDLDDGVKFNYEKVQTARDGKKMQILAKI